MWFVIMLNDEHIFIYDLLFSNISLILKIIRIVNLIYFKHKINFKIYDSFFLNNNIIFKL